MVRMPSTPVNRPMRFSSALAHCADRTSLPVRSGPQDAPNQGALFFGGLLGNDIVVSDQRFRFGEARIGIVADGSEGFAVLNAVANAFVKLKADGIIDGVFLLCATAAENSEGNAELLAVGAGDVAGGMAGNIEMKAGLGQAMRCVDHAVVTTLQANTLLEFFLGMSAGDHRFGQVAALLDAFG